MSTTADLLAPRAQAGAGPEPRRGLPRLLAVAGEHGNATPLARHRLAFPTPPLPGRAGDDLIAAVERSGLRGRGGASFPTGRKLRAVRDARRRPIVVVNGAEGEPTSGKDKLLLTTAPHLVLDGALLAAAAVGARQVVVCVDQAATAALGAVQRALAERQRAEAALPVRLAAIPSRYVAGEETALVHWLNPGPASTSSPSARPSPTPSGSPAAHWRASRASWSEATSEAGSAPSRRAGPTSATSRCARSAPAWAAAPSRCCPRAPAA